MTGLELSSTQEIEPSESFKAGNRLALRRLDQILTAYHQVNAEELATNFERYLKSILEICDWNGAFLDGIFKVLFAVQSFIDSDKKPEEVVDEVTKIFTSVDANSYNMELSEGEKKRRYNLIGKLSQQFHPDSPLMKEFEEDEVSRRIDIFKSRISHALQTDGKAGLQFLEEIANDENIK